MCSPIVLFVYNRPEHTRKTIEALLKNDLAEQSELFVYCDGPRSDADSEKVLQVRDYVNRLTGFRSVRIIERDENIGLAQSIITGVTEIVNRFGRIIVLEDDIVTSRYFLRYMNDALVHYQDVDKVMHISGYMFPIDSNGLPETFFYRSTSCWGWGTWKRSWCYFEKEPVKLLNEFSKNDREEFCLNGATDHWKQVVSNFNGRINTWAVFWYASVFRLNGLCLHPAESLVENIGHDGSGSHCGIDQLYDVALKGVPIALFPDVLEENLFVVSRLREWHQSRRFDIFYKLLRKFKKLFLIK